MSRTKDSLGDTPFGDLFHRRPDPPRPPTPAPPIEATDPGILSRSDDPGTSKKAAHNIGPSTRNTAGKVAKMLYRHGGPMSDEQIELEGRARYGQIAEGGYRKRRSDLLNSGHVRDSGQVTRSVDNQEVTLWELTEIGREAARKLIEVERV